MKNKLSGLLLALSATLTATAQTVAVDAQPAAGQSKSVLPLGPRISIVDFVPADAVTKADQRHAGQHKAANIHYSYSSTGHDMRQNATTSWRTLFGKSDDGTQDLALNIVPDVFGMENGIMVPYEVVATKLRIKPVRLGTASGYNIILCSDMSDGIITLTLHGNGVITADPDMTILYGAFTTSTYSRDAYKGYLDAYQNISYTKDVVTGDANEDARFTTDDALTIVGHILGRENAAADVDAMDTNYDGEINVADVIGMSRIIKESK